MRRHSLSTGFFTGRNSRVAISAARIESHLNHFCQRGEARVAKGLGTDGGYGDAIHLNILSQQEGDGIAAFSGDRQIQSSTEIETPAFIEIIRRVNPRDFGT